MTTSDANTSTGDGFSAQVAAIQQYFDSPRFAGITRLYTARQVAEQRGTIGVDYTVAREAATAFYARLRELFAEKKSITTFGPYSPGQAVTMKRCGIEGIYLGGWATSAKGSTTEDPGPDLASYPLSQVPDEAAGLVRALLTADRNQQFLRLQMTEEQRAAVPPVDYRPFIIADADTGYGGPANIARTMEEYGQAGVAAVHLEDQVAPKRCGQLAGIRLIDAAEAARRLRCAIASRPANGPLVIGRTDAMPAIGAEEAVRRALMYQDAGVDLVFVDGIKRIEEVEIVARRVPGPKVVSIVDGNETTALTAQALEQMGFAVVLYAVSLLFAASKAMADTLAVLKRDGTPAAAGEAMMTYGQFSTLVDLPRFQALDEAFG